MARRIGLTIGLSVFSLALTLAGAGPIAPLKSLAWRLLATPARAATEAARSSRSLIDLIRSIRTLHEENQTLKAENLRLKAELAELAEVRHENELLKTELGFVAANRERYSFVPARVIGRSPSTYLQFMIVDRGLNDGVAVGQAATSQGYLVGRVASTTATTARIELITASRSLLPILLSESRATGLLKGGLAGLTGEEFQTDQPIAPGQGVVSSSLGELLPADLAVGNVQERLSGESEFVSRIRIHSPVEFGKLESIIILQSK